MFSLISLFSRFAKRPLNYYMTAEESTTCGKPGDGIFETLSPKLLQAISQCIPGMSYDKHKGQAGRICVIGGSEEYTGAPHYAGISALKCGADLATIITTPAAATPIKSYNPEHIVLPYLHGEEAVKNIVTGLPRYHSVVLGTGLGRDPKTLDIAEKLIHEIKEQGLPLVIDADGLFLVTQKPEIIEGFDKLILTPNSAEFERLYRAVLHKSPTEGEPIIDVKRLAKKLAVTILRKGAIDIISDGSVSLIVNTEVSPRRSGGQGDILAGLLGVFNHWMHEAQLQPSMQHEKHMDLYGPTMLASVAACAMTRQTNTAAFKKYGRATLATDMIKEIGDVFVDIFETKRDFDKF